MIFDLVILLFQPIFSSVFIFLLPVLYEFFNSNLKELNLKIIFYSFLTDLLFLRPLGFFLFLTSFSFLILSFLEKIFDYAKIYQRIIFLFSFNVVFIVGFLFLSSVKANFQFFFRIFLFNIIFQLFYLETRNLLGK